MQNNYEKLTSIIIPARNIDYLLEECIQKIRELYSSIQIIIILDETDNEKTCKYPNNIKIIKAENPNMSAKRNLGVKNADTKYIAFIDSDSYPNEGWLETGVNFLENNNNYTAVTGNQFNPINDSFEQKCLRLVRFSPLFTHEEWCKVIDKNAHECDCTEFMTSNVIIKAKYYSELGGMNENIYLAEDNEFSKRLIQNNYKIRFIPKVCVYHHECKLIPYLRKIYAMSYYYANTFIKGKPVKTEKETLKQYLPLIGIILFCFLFGIFAMLKMNPLYLISLPLIILGIFLIEAVKTSLKLEKENIKGFIFIFTVFCLFCLIWVIGTLFGTINFPIKDIKNYYKHY